MFWTVTRFDRVTSGLFVSGSTPSFNAIVTTSLPFLWCVLTVPHWPHFFNAELQHVLFWQPWQSMSHPVGMGWECVSIHHQNYFDNEWCCINRSTASAATNSKIGNVDFNYSRQTEKASSHCGQCFDSFKHNPWRFAPHLTAMRGRLEFMQWYFSVGVFSKIQKGKHNLFLHLFVPPPLTTICHQDRDPSHTSVWQLLMFAWLFCPLGTFISTGGFLFCIPMKHWFVTTNYLCIILLDLIGYWVSFG